MGTGDEPRLFWVGFPTRVRSRVDLFVLLDVREPGVVTEGVEWTGVGRYGRGRSESHRRVGLTSTILSPRVSPVSLTGTNGPSRNSSVQRSVSKTRVSTVRVPRVGPGWSRNPFRTGGIRRRWTVSRPFKWSKADDPGPVRRGSNTVWSDVYKDGHHGSPTTVRSERTESSRWDCPPAYGVKSRPLRFRGT